MRFSNRRPFPTDDSLLKMLYLAMMDISRKMRDAPSVYFPALIFLTVDFWILKSSYILIPPLPTGA